MVLSDISVPLLILGTILYYSISFSKKEKSKMNGNGNSMFFLMSKHACGWGDRLVGLSSAIIMAKYLNKKLFILWDDKQILNEMSVFFEPNHTWLYLEPKHKQEFFKNAQFYDWMHLGQADEIRSVLASLLSTTNNKKKQNIVVKMNQPYGSVVFNSGEREKYSKSLFEAYNDIKTKYFVFKSSYQEKWMRELSTINLCLGVQVRTGDKSAVGASHNFHLLLDEPDYPAFCKSLLQNNAVINNENIYIASDDVKFIDTLKREDKNSKNILTAGIQENIHFDDKNSAGKKETIFKEYFYLTQCKMLITSKNSNFGITAAYLGNHDSLIFYEFTEKKEILLKKYNIRQNAVNKENTLVHDLNEFIFV